MKLIEEQEKEALLSQAGQEIGDIFQSNHDKPILFLSSGGSSLEILKHVPPISSSSQITIGALDERYDYDPNINNFAQLTRTEFYKQNASLFQDFLDTTVQDGETLELYAGRFEGMLRGWRKKHPQGVIVATTGMGPDGHISGIMPRADNPVIFEGLFNNPAKWVVGYESSLQYPIRATTTIPFLKEIDYAVAFISGGNKKDALGRVLQEEGELNVTPARVLRQMKNVVLFTDIKF